MKLQEIASIIDLDLERTFALFMGKEEMYVKYLKKFPGNVERLLDDLETAVADNDKHGIEAAAHGIKGVAANLGIQKVTALGTALMLDIRDNTSDKINEHYEQLVEKTREAISYIQKLD
jgi:HPt (histidine-containing phosphotransfer) domain-containing protein